MTINKKTLNYGIMLGLLDSIPIWIHNLKNLGRSETSQAKIPRTDKLDHWILNFSNPDWSILDLFEII